MIVPLTVAQLQREGAALFAPHAKEAGTSSNVDVDWDTYLSLEGAGLLQVLGVRIADKLVGYAVTTVRRHLNSGERIGVNLALYVAPEHRGAAGGNLMLAVEAAVREARAVRMLWSAKPSSPLDRVLKQRAGYRRIETIYALEL